MDKEFVTYRQALLLKELGFNEDTFGGYDFEDKQLYIGYENEYGRTWNLDFYIHAPLKQRVFRWFREKYNLHHIVIWDSDTNNFDAGLFGELVTPFLEEDTIFHTYEEAENACIDKLLEIAKNQVIS